MTALFTATRHLRRHDTRPRRPKASRYRVGLAVAMTLALVVTAGAQETWYRIYQSAERAFRDGDYAGAENRLLAVLKHPDAPTIKSPAAPTGSERGRRVHLFGMVYGYYPEAYLALVYERLKRFDDADRYATVALRYLRAGDDLFPRVQSAQRTVRQALTDVEGRRTLETHLAAARSALTNDQFADARRELDAARRLGAEASLVDPLSSQVTRRESASLLARAEPLVAQGRLAEARELADRILALGVDPAAANALIGRIGAASTVRDREAAFQSARQEAEQALAGLRYAEARGAIGRARATGLGTTDLDRIERQISVAELEGQVKTHLGRRAWDDLGPVLARLTALDPNNAVALSARETMGRSAPSRGSVPSSIPAVPGGRATATATAALPAAVSPLAKPDAALRLGLSAFYRGRYQEAVGALTPLKGSARVDQARVHLYLAASRAGLSVVDPRQAEALRRAAQLDLEAIRGRLGDVSADVSYLSPAIRQILSIP